MLPEVILKDVTFNSNRKRAITGVPGLSLPTYRRSSHDLAGADGGIYSATYHGRRRFSLQGMLIGDSVAEMIALRDELSLSLASYKERHDITFTRADGLVLQITAGLIDKPDFDPDPELPTATQFNLSFEATFPYLVSQQLRVYVLAISQPGGATIPATIPMSLSMSSGGNQFADNAGTAGASPIVYINGPVTNPSLRNLTTNQDMLFTLTLAAGESLTINTVTHTVVDNTGRNRRGDFVGSWWEVLRGTSELAFVADTSGVGASAVVTYPDTYLYL